MINKPKFAKFYMKLADFIAKQNTICGSRKVAAVIVDRNNKVKGIGYNGPPAGTPHCNTKEYLHDIVLPMTDLNQRDSLELAYGSVEKALDTCEGCPRKFLGYGPGEKSEMCSCQHAESNAIVNAACDISGCAMYCTLTPCVNCTGMIINSRICEIHFPQSDWYQPQAQLLLQWAGIDLFPHPLKLQPPD